MTQPPGSQEPNITPGQPLWATPPAAPSPTNEPAGPPAAGPPADPDRTTVMPGYGQPGPPPPPGSAGGPGAWQQTDPSGQPIPPGQFGQPGGPPPFGGPGGPPPFGGPGGPGFPGGQPPKKGKGLLIGGIVGAVVLAVVVGVLGFVFLGGGSPTDSVDSYLTALKEGDEQTANEYVCQSRQSKSIGLSREATKDTSKATWTILGERVTDKKAEVDVDIVVEKEGTIDITFILVDEDGWKLCDAKARKPATDKPLSK